MSEWVYLTIDLSVTTVQEETSVSLRIQSSAATVKALHTRLPQADLKDDVRLVRRLTVLLDLLGPHVPIAGLSARWGRSTSCLYDWPQAFGLHGLDRFGSRPRGGRRPQLPPKQNKRRVERREAGPRGGGGEPACWHSVRIRVLSGRECGVLSTRQDVWTLLHHVGVSLQQARLVSDHRDAAQRLAWLQERWPALVRAAQRRSGLLL
jgi:transposase